jgi:gamma-glutamyltranspeptidase/glutathione hydrolase
MRGMPHFPAPLEPAAAWRRAPARAATVAHRAIVATSQPQATEAGLRMLDRGGSAVDAALAAAAVLCVTEPMMTGIGGDLFALLWEPDGRGGGTPIALDAAGPAAAAAATGRPVAHTGPASVTVPGAVAGWAALAERGGRLGLDTCLADAIDLAERGYALGGRAEALWRTAAHQPFGRSPGVGGLVRLPELAATLRAIAERGPAVVYEELADRIAAATELDPTDLAAMSAAWVEPLRRTHRGVEVLELPPPTQGVVVLEALGLLEGSDGGLADQVRAVALALEDAGEHVRDRADVGHLLDPAFLARRRGERPRDVPHQGGGTTFLAVVDEDRMGVALIQSLFHSFGSGVLVPGTGMVLHNRGAGFALGGGAQAGVRPFHTLVPGMLAVDGRLGGPFGVMGGTLQAQAHVQLVCALVDEGLDPQAALDRARFRVEGSTVLLEEGLWDRADELEQDGWRTERAEGVEAFGGGQAVLVHGDVLVGGSDARKDGYAGVR